MSEARLIVRVLLPFAAGYYLSYLFRSINALIAADLSAELNLSAADLGFLTSVYFLVLAAAQLPLGVLLDRYGPETIQSILLLFASAGALVFATASGFLGLVLGRGLLALGVALTLMAGFKAIVLWFPPEHVTLANGWLVMLGALGAVTATGPAEVIVRALGWRGLFVVLGALSSLAALLLLFLVPESAPCRPERDTAKPLSLCVVYRHRRFWRIAPLSAIGIGTSWSLQGLWAAPWLRDVDHLDRSDVVQHLTLMGFAVCFGALLLGTVARWLRRTGIKTEWTLASTLMTSMAAQALLVFRAPMPSLLLWVPISAAGAATVLSFAILGDYFPKELSGRANAALNLLHLGCAFLLQSATGLIIAQWPESQGMHPAPAHQYAMAATLALQLSALAWFAASPLRLRIPEFTGAPRQHLARSRSLPVVPIMLYVRTGLPRAQLAQLVRKQAASWRFAAAASTTLTLGLTAVLFVIISRPAVAIHIVEASRTAEVTSAGTQFENIEQQTADPGLIPAVLFATGSAAQLPDKTRPAISAVAPILEISQWQMKSTMRHSDDQNGPTNSPHERHTRRALPHSRAFSHQDSRKAAVRRHRSQRSHHQYSICRLLPKCANGASMRSQSRANPLQHPVRHRQTRVGVSG
jgi:predicted MFS family arabinose efflux permease